MIKVLFNKQIHRKNAYFCTQFVASILKESGVELSSKPSCLVTPADLEQAPILKKVYQGYLQSYLNSTHTTQNVNAYATIYL